MPYRQIRSLGMQVAFLLYDRFTALDWVGPHEVFNSLPDAECVTVAEKTGPIANETGSIEVVAAKTLDEVTSPEIVVIPGGLGNRLLLEHEPLHEWIREVHETSEWTTSVCTGSLLLAAAGLLDGKKAATHWMARDLLTSLGAEAVPDRVVEEGKIITAAGVSSGIDMALRLVQKMHGDDAAQTVQLGIEYDPQPAFDSGSPEKARPEIVEAARQAMIAQATG